MQDREQESHFNSFYSIHSQLNILTVKVSKDHWYEKHQLKVYKLLNYM